MSFATPVIGSSLAAAAKRICLAGAVAFLIGAGMPSANAAPAASGAFPTFATVDLAKVYAGSKIKHDDDVQLQVVGASYDTALKTLQTNVMLSPNDLTLLAGLLVKPAPTADDTAAIAKYEAAAKADADALTALQQKPDKDQTADDKAKLASLSAEFQAGQGALQTVQQTFQDSMQQKNDALNQAAAELIHAAIAKIAAKQGIAVVFSSQVAVYASIDLTETVTKDMSN